MHASVKAPFSPRRGEKKKNPGPIPAWWRVTYLCGPCGWPQQDAGSQSSGKAGNRLQDCTSPVSSECTESPWHRQDSTWSFLKPLNTIPYAIGTEILSNLLFTLRKVEIEKVFFLSFGAMSSCTSLYGDFVWSDFKISITHNLCVYRGNSF